MSTEIKNEAVEPAPWWAWAIIVVIIAIFVALNVGGGRGGFASASTDYPICADTEEGVELTVAKPEAKLPLNMNCWSGWVSLPNNVDFRVNNGKGNDLEYLFWDGRRRFISGKEKTWFGKIGGYNFRLRGGGVAAISIEPKV